MLSPAIPCHYHDTDLKMMDTLVRHLGALRHAIHSLESYYHALEGNIVSPPHNAFHPYPTSFTTQDGLVKRFKYLSSMKGCNLFFGKIEDDSGAAICVKFITRYCEQAHNFLAERELAPRLHVVERLPGGQYMVVMDDISNDYTSLFNFIQDNPDLLSEDNEDTRNLFLQAVRDCLIQLHQACLVHGDIRNTNIMVKIVGLDDLSFFLVDYGSGGEIQQVRYPLDLNTSTVKRPEGATDIPEGAFTQMCRLSSERSPAKSDNNLLLGLNGVPLLGSWLEARSSMRKDSETRKRSRSEASTFSKRWDLSSLITFFRMPMFLDFKILDRKRVGRQVTVNETVEAEKLRVGRWHSED
jgi:serine/threonine protein kinase